jgi:hypothetical protein
MLHQKGEPLRTERDTSEKIYNGMGRRCVALAGRAFFQANDILINHASIQPP